MKYVPVTAEEKEEIKRLREQKYSTGQIANAMKLSTATVYQILRLDENYKRMHKREDAPELITPETLENFKQTVCVGDKFKIFRTLVDDDGRRRKTMTVVTVKGVYPNIADCDIGSYKYIDLMQGERIYE